MLHLPGSINKALANYVLCLVLLDSVPYLCALSLKLTALPDELHPFNYSNAVSCSMIPILLYSVRMPGSYGISGEKGRSFPLFGCHETLKEC